MHPSQDSDRSGAPEAAASDAAPAPKRRPRKGDTPPHQDEPKLREWPADQVERWPLERIVPYPRNARLHSDEQVAQIAASMKRFGVTAPLLVDELGVLIYGHGRLRGAQLLGLTALPVCVARGWSEDEKAAYRVTDNQLALNAEWDMPVLKIELTALKLAGFDMPLLGFDNFQLVQFLAGQAGADPEHVPDPPAEPVTRMGDLWLLGDHRLLAGDATLKEDVDRVLSSETPHLMVTDPPYGVDYDPKWRVEAKRSDGRSFLTGAVSTGAVQNDDRADWSDAWLLFSGAVAYVWHAGLHAHVVAASLAASGFVLRSQIIWAKQNFVIGRGDYHWMHEPCWYAVRKGAAGRFVGDRTQRTVWHIDNHSGGRTADDGATVHGTQKPVECMKRPIENNSVAGDAVYDPFVGSGTTIIAAEMTARRCCALEIDPAYVDVAVLRWQAFTGRQATHEATGATFEAVAGERAGTKKGAPVGAPLAASGIPGQAAR